MDPHIKLKKSDDDVLDDPSTYRKLIGRLLYLTISRPNIVFVVKTISQFLVKPYKSHLTTAHNLLRYLKSSPGQGILISPVNNFQLKSFVDFDWASCLDTRKSTSGFCIFIGDTLISWKTKKQIIVSRSLAEAGYIAFASTTCEII